MNWHYQIRKRVVENHEFYDVAMVGSWGSLGHSSIPCGPTRKAVLDILKKMLADAKKYPVLEDISEQPDWSQLHKGVGE